DCRFAGRIGKLWMAPATALATRAMLNFSLALCRLSCDIAASLCESFSRRTTSAASLGPDTFEVTRVLYEHPKSTPRVRETLNSSPRAKRILRCAWECEAGKAVGHSGRKFRRATGAARVPNQAAAEFE